MLFFVMLAACGRVGFDRARDARDGEPVDAAEVDARIPCTGPFGAPRLIPNVNSTVNDWGGHLTEDRLELYFGSNRFGGTNIDIYVAKRASATDLFGTPVRLDDFATVNADDNPFVTADGLTMWFDSNKEIHFATRATTSDPWGPAIIVPSLNSVNEDVAASLSVDELMLYLTSTRIGTNGGYDVWISKRTSKDDVFSTPIVLAGAINTAGFDCCAWVAPGGTELWFTGSPLMNEIQVIQRDPVTGLTSGTPVVNPLFDSSSNDVDVFGTLAGEVIGFSSARPGGLGGFDLYFVERSCP